MLMAPCVIIIAPNRGNNLMGSQPLTPIHPDKLRRLHRVPVDDSRPMYTVDGLSGLTYSMAYDKLTASTYIDPISKKWVYSKNLIPRILQLNKLHLSRVEIRRLLTERVSEVMTLRHEDRFAYDPAPTPTEQVDTAAIDQRLEADETRHYYE